MNIRRTFAKTRRVIHLLLVGMLVVGALSGGYVYWHVHAQNKAFIGGISRGSRLNAAITYKSILVISYSYCADCLYSEFQHSPECRWANFGRPYVSTGPRPPDRRVAFWRFRWRLVTALGLHSHYFYVPLWSPFVLFAVYPVIYAARFPARRRRYRRKHGLCMKCGYNLKGNTSGKCSECGTEMAEARPC